MGSSAPKPRLRRAPASRMEQTLQLLLTVEGMVALNNCFDGEFGSQSECGRDRRMRRNSSSCRHRRWWRSGMDGRLREISGENGGWDGPRALYEIFSGTESGKKEKRKSGERCHGGKIKVGKDKAMHEVRIGADCDEPQPNSARCGGRFEWEAMARALLRCTRCGAQRKALM
eukprot:g8822.t1